MLQLVLMRHGKSDWDVSYGADHERPLAERGVRSARLVGGSHRRVLVVGHEPTWSNLVFELVGARVEMKTASVAGVGLPIDEWTSLPDVTVWLDYLIHPRMFSRGADWFDSD